MFHQMIPYVVKFNAIQMLVSSIRNQMTSSSCKQTDVMTVNQKFEIIRRATNLYHYIVTQHDRSLFFQPFHTSTVPWNPKITSQNVFLSILDKDVKSFCLPESVTDMDSGFPSGDSLGKSLFISNTVTHECPLCGKKHNSSSALKMHQRTHNPPCICPQCGKAFSRMWLLSGHLRIHTGERPYVCNRCQRAFADRSNLRAHMQTHTTRKRYQCDKCPRSFSRQSLLRKHTSQCCSKSMDIN